MAKVKSKKNQNIESVQKWSEISKLKSSIDIVFEDKILFSIRGLNDSEFSKFINQVKPEKQNKIEDINVLLNNEGNMATILKMMVVGVDFEDMDDKEIVECMNGFPVEITMQVNKALNTLLIDNMIKYLKNMGENIKIFKSIGEMDEVVRKMKVENVSVTNIVQ